MKMYPRLLVISWIVCSGWVFAQEAQNPDNVLPPPPWLAKAPDMSHWEVDYSRQQSDSSNSAVSATNGASKKTPDDKTIEVIKTGKTIFQQITDYTGGTNQTWRKDGLIVMKGGPSNPWFVAITPSPKDSFQDVDYIKADFAGFDWITAANFAGMQIIGGEKCLVFKAKVLALPPDDVVARQTQMSLLYQDAVRKNPKSPPSPAAYTVDLEKLKVDAEADIDLKTLLPISLKLGPIVRTYKFLPPPTTEVELPGDAQLAFNTYKKAYDAMMNVSGGSR
jgi:hypothetical protein